MSAKQSMGDAWEDDWESQADVGFTRPATSLRSRFPCDLCIRLTCVAFPSETGRRTHPAPARKESVLQGDQGATPGPADGI